MKLSELLNKAEAAYAEHGNLEVKLHVYECGTFSLTEADFAVGLVTEEVFFVLEPK